MSKTDLTKPDQEPKLNLTTEAGNNLRVTMSGDFLRLAEAIGNDQTLAGLLTQLSALGAHRKSSDEAATNFALGFVHTMAPRDAAEALLLAQMAAIHQAMMTFARRLNLVETIPQQDSAERALNKLARTYAAQVEALKRYRSTGQQKVVVEHVTVNAGGQAIVGAVSRGEGAMGE